MPRNVTIGDPVHPQLVELIADPNSTTAVAGLRAALVEAGGPLRRVLADGTVELTFVWIGEAESVSLQCGLASHDGRPVEMQRIATSPVWVATVESPADALVSYRFVLDDPFLGAGQLDDDGWQRLMIQAQQQSFADPSNPSRIRPLAVLFGLEAAPEQWESILSLGEPAETSWFRPHQSPRGTEERFELASIALGDTRDVTVYLPPGYSEQTLHHPLVVLLDGPSWITLGEMPRALDAAIAHRAIAAPVVAFVHQAHDSGGLADRVLELSCNPAHARMLLDELLPHLRADYRVDPSPTATVLGGASLGGLAATYTAMEQPGAIGNVLSVSGSYWYGCERDDTPEWLARRLAVEPAGSFRLYQQVGRLEDAPLSLSPGVSHLVANRHFRDVAVAKGHDVIYDELTTAHDLAAFRVAAMRGLGALLPAGVS